jgi:hypothetical protein
VIVEMRWSEEARFEYEPTNPVTNKKPEFLVETADHLYLFEVKCPALIDHQWNRLLNEQHFPARTSASRSLLGDPDRPAGKQATLPRDNVVKDFLSSAQDKFRNFREGKATSAWLIFAWDAEMYEPIGSLNHPESGLLTANSFHKRSGSDEAVTFDAVDGVIILNHLNVLAAALQDRPPVRREDVFAFLEQSYSPNVWLPIRPGTAPGPEMEKAFDLAPAEAMGQIASDYSYIDAVIRLESPDQIALRMKARAQKARMFYGVSRLAFSSVGLIP